MIVLTTDPSLTAFGYAVVQDDGVAPVILEVGCLKTIAYPQRKKGKPKPPMLKSEWETLRLKEIGDKLREVCISHGVNLALYEDPAGSKNFNAIRALSEVKGLCIGLFTGLQLPFQAIRAKEVKKNLTSDIDADKEQVAAVVEHYFPDIYDSFKEAGFTTKVQRESVYDALGVYCSWNLSQS
jgi:Holliday junction resolvasome RuvABC endonuclease subunit